MDPAHQRDDLIQRFPDLGTAAKEAAVAAFNQLPTDVVGALDASADAWSREVTECLSAWAKNNRELLVYLLTKASSDVEQARSLIEDRRSRYLNGLGTSGDVPAAARVFRERVEADAIAIMKAMDQAPCLPRCTVFRGFGVGKSEFLSTYTLGSSLDWQTPLACTIEPFFAPLHFAWKGWIRQIEKGAAEADVVAVILEIKCPADKLLRGFWTARLLGKHQETTYDWQAEVVLAPPVRLKINDLHDLRPDRPGNLIHVVAQLV